MCSCALIRPVHAISGQIRRISWGNGRPGLPLPEVSTMARGAAGALLRRSLHVHVHVRACAAQAYPRAIHGRTSSLVGVYVGGSYLATLRYGNPCPVATCQRSHIVSRVTSGRIFGVHPCFFFLPSLPFLSACKRSSLCYFYRA
jgi:hypothetical protein